ncbi:MAG: pteridine reductase [Piscirickettsiaceae bacterium]|nr:MAG: pteridine reductase [Piscirickettsiaceae bacterium]
MALITGAAYRIGAEIAETLHSAGYGVVVHYRQSQAGAEKLVQLLNGRRPHSAWAVNADLQSVDEIKAMVADAIAINGRLDVLVNNASGFYQTPVAAADEQQWDELMGSNLKAPFFVSQAAFPALKKQRGSIVNIVDIYAKNSLADFSIYSAAKAGLTSLTASLAKELAPAVRVNGVSPGAILWPKGQEESMSAEIVQKIPLQRQGSAKDIAETVLFLATQASYITGQVIAVDGGKSLV